MIEPKQFFATVFFDTFNDNHRVVVQELHKGADSKPDIWKKVRLEDLGVEDDT